jgi:hypothetical protein
LFFVQVFEDGQFFELFLIYQSVDFGVKFLLGMGKVMLLAFFFEEVLVFSDFVLELLINI